MRPLKKVFWDLIHLRSTAREPVAISSRIPAANQMAAPIEQNTAQNARWYTKGSLLVIVIDIQLQPPSTAAFLP